MAANLRELLDGIDGLVKQKDALQAIPLDTTAIVGAFDAVIGEAHLQAGAVLLPADAPQSTVIFYPDTGTLRRFNPQTDRVEVITPVDPATLTLQAPEAEPLASPSPGPGGDFGTAP